LIIEFVQNMNSKLTKHFWGYGKVDGPGSLLDYQKKLNQNAASVHHMKQALNYSQKCIKHNSCFYLSILC